MGVYLEYQQDMPTPEERHEGALLELKWHLQQKALAKLSEDIREALKLAQVHCPADYIAEMLDNELARFEADNGLTSYLQGEIDRLNSLLAASGESKTETGAPRGP